MTARVELLPRAIRDLEEAVSWIRKENQIAAEKWLTSIEDAIFGLSTFPRLWPLAPENAILEFEVRNLLHASGSERITRILYTITDHGVWVLRIRRPGQSLLRKCGLRFRPPYREPDE